MVGGEEGDDDFFLAVTALPSIPSPFHLSALRVKWIPVRAAIDVSTLQKGLNESLCYANGILGTPKPLSCSEKALWSAIGIVGCTNYLVYLSF